MSKKYDYDYIIIGSGPAGTTAALELAKSKKSIAIVEGRFFGGTNLNTRDIPYKVALDFAHTYSKVLSYPEFKNQDFNFNLPTIAARELKTIISVGGNSKKIYEDANIACIKGFANFLDHHTIAVNEKKYTSSNFIIAAGSSLKTDGISGAAFVKYLTPESAITIRRLPKVVAIVGAGSTGCEIAEYFAELGVKVILLETSDRILPREDSEVGDTLFSYFSEKLGMTVLPSSKVVALEEDDFSKRVIFSHEGSEKLVRVDCIVLATGSQPNLDLGLENAKIKYKSTGILRNRLFETSSKNIYAIGDCVNNSESSTERASYEGLTLANNILHRSKNTPNYKGFVRTVNTFPEVATIGLSEDDLIRRDRSYNKAIVKLSDLTISKVANLDYGFIKLLSDKNNSRVLGATIVAPHAELMASEISLAIRHNLPIVELASTPHPVNNYNYLIKLAAKSLLTKKSR